MDKLYSYKKYKMVCEPVFKENREFGAVYCEPDIYIEERDEFLEILRKDINNMTYSEIYRDSPDSQKYGLRLEMAVKENQDGTNYPQSFYITMDERHENSMKWLTEKGYIDSETEVVESR